MSNEKKDKLESTGFQVGTAWDVVGFSESEAIEAEEKYQEMNKKV